MGEFGTSGGIDRATACGYPGVYVDSYLAYLSAKLPARNIPFHLNPVPEPQYEQY